MKSSLLSATFGLAALLGISGCIIEDRPIGDELRNAGNDDDDDPGGGDDASTGPSDACREYCEDAIENCPDDLSVYTGQEICESLCQHFPEGDPDSPEGNTLACRAQQARLAGTTGEPEVHCPNAGPGGNSRGNNIGCGTDCEAYCYLHPRLCDIEGQTPLEEDECLRQCAGLREKPTFDVVVDHDGDSLECRLQHLTSASAAPAEHCWHATIAPGEGSPCGDPAGSEVACDAYCNLVMTACTDDHQMYESEDQCIAVCEALPPGVAGDETEDTVACRLYHSYNALPAPAAHCLHAGPTGDGHCGLENCTSYCIIAQASCGSEFEAVFLGAGSDAGPLGTCPSDCMELEGAARDESNFSIAPDARGDTVGCRTLHAMRALEDASECSAALGGNPCD